MLVFIFSTFIFSLIKPRGFKSIQGESVLKTFQQKVNHSDENSNLFTMRFYENLVHNKNNQVIFLCIGGESDGFSPYGEGDFIEELATEHNAIILTTEHRYFGESHPFSNTKTENLALCTVQQAIDDLIYFREWYQKENNLPSNASWILVGGSYPGLLSAFTRAQKPEYFKGALASSGVVLANNKYSDFDLQIAISMGQECAAVARNVRNRIDKLLLSDDRDWLLSQFSAQGVEIEVFRFVVGEIFSLAPQYGRRSLVCGPLEDSLRTGNDPLMALAKFTRDTFSPLFCDGNISNTYSNSRMKDTSNINSGSRMWLWMTCNELAYWQVSPGRLGLRSPLVNQEFFSNQCKDVFGIEMFPDTDAFNNKYHGLSQTATNVYYTTGSQDPWTPVCITDEQSLPEGSYAHTITGPEVGHCSDLHASKDTDPIDLKRTRLHIRKVISQWIYQ